MSEHMTTFLELKHLTFTYPEQREPALTDLSLSIQEGEFLLLCGPSGSGKSTLLRQLKSVLAPHGSKTGDILFQGRPLEQWSHRDQSARIGFVLQNPENQIVTDKVWHELAFGLESLGLDNQTIRRRVAEMASFFGIESWFHQTVSSLSGGQKQLLNLASIMAMQPALLILDEPTSQLDPIAASEFLAAVSKINRELGTTVILTEQRLEEALPLSSRVAVMNQGKLFCTGTAQEVGLSLRDADHGMFLAMPTAMRLWAAVESPLPCPVTVREGCNWFHRFAAMHSLLPLPEERIPQSGPETVITAEELWFKYEKDGPNVVQGLNLQVKKGEFFALMGGNGTGKTTGLKLIAGLLTAYRGQLSVTGRVGVLPQNPQALLVKKTVRADLLDILPQGGSSSAENELTRLVHLCRLDGLLERHPYDLSGGEQQRVALAKVLLLAPDILFLDEPTKGLDAEFKQVLAGILRTLLRQGVTIFMVSHDIEFCARHAHRCAMFFDGNIVTEGTPRAFFSGNSFYTTSANRIARGLLPHAVTDEDIILACGGTLPSKPEPPEADMPMARAAAPMEQPRPVTLSPWRAALACIAALAVSLCFAGAMGLQGWPPLAVLDGLFPQTTEPMGLYLILIAALLVLAIAVGRRAPPPLAAQVPRERRRLNRRTVAATILILLLIPLTLLIGIYYLADRKHYFISLLILLECMLPFFMVFEGRKPQARELVVIASLCAISVAGRAAFFMLPQFKPVMALVIIAGVAFGGEAGFLVGAVTMLVSNMMFSQGPWTPWQMFAMGIIGFLAGVLFRKGLLRRGRASLCIFGALAAIVIYGGILNPASALMWINTLNWNIILAYCITGFPMDCVQGAATALFLWFAAEPMLEKLDRIKVKYGLVE